nr:YjbQ family protein [Gimesia aquarii]
MNRNRLRENRLNLDLPSFSQTRQKAGCDIMCLVNGKLHLGPWEHIFYYEFDGRRRKRILVKIIGE